jgi:hypothetical protein
MVLADHKTEVFSLALFRDTASSLVVTPLAPFLPIDTSDTERFHDGQSPLAMLLKNGPNTP